MNDENLEKGAPHRFKPGQSGNPGGRPGKRPISDRYAEVAALKMPDKDRIRLGLPEGATYGLALAVIVFNAALHGKIDAAREIREAIEGKTAPRKEEAETVQMIFDLPRPNRTAVALNNSVSRESTE